MSVATTAALAAAVQALGGLVGGGGGGGAGGGGGGGGAGGGGGGGGAGGGAAPDPADESYQNSHSTINALMGTPFVANFAYPAEYRTALRFQMQFETLYDTEIPGSHEFAMERFSNVRGESEAIANMDFHNVMFIMTLCEWGGLRGMKDGNVYSDSTIVHTLDQPMTSDHMGTYCTHLHNLYMYIILPPKRDDVIDLCPENEGLYNENSQGMCGVRTSRKMMQVARDGRYKYSNAVTLLVHGEGFGGCLFRGGSSSRMLRK